jgi:hypothetical protein
MRKGFVIRGFYPTSYATVKTGNTVNAFNFRKEYYRIT